MKHGIFNETQLFAISLLGSACLAYLDDPESHHATALIEELCHKIGTKEYAMYAAGMVGLSEECLELIRDAYTN